LKRSQSDSALAQHGRQDEAVLVHQQQTSQSQLPFSDFCDEHFAISEATLDQVRSQCDGNWIDQNHREFRETHGQFVEYTDQTASFQEHEETEEEDKCCQTSFGPGICKEQVAGELRTKYDTLFSEVVDILRTARDVRRHDGYVAQHPLMLICSQDHDAVGEGRFTIVYVFLLTRMSFNPFDSTLLQFSMASESEAVMATDNGRAVLHRLQVLLFNIAQTPDVYCVKTGSYKAISLNSIKLDVASLMRPCVATRVPVQDEGVSDGSEGEERLGLSVNTTRQAMMRALQGSKVNKPVKKNNGKGNGNGNRKNNTGPPKGKSRSKVKSKTSAIADTSQGDVDKAGKLDEDTMKEWGVALEHTLGPVPVPLKNPSKKEASSSSLPGVQKQSGPPPIPIMSYTMPWRDVRGYCWEFNADSGKARHLGPCLR